MVAHTNLKCRYFQNVSKHFKNYVTQHLGQLESSGPRENTGYGTLVQEELIALELGRYK